MAEHNDLGKWGEDMAAEYLCKEGYVILDRNWRYGKSKVDLDIVCKSADGEFCVFVEVKTRYGEQISEPEDAVDQKKVRGLGHAANRYVQLYDIAEEPRFDILTIEGHQAGENISINHIVDAFNPLLL